MRKAFRSGVGLTLSLMFMATHVHADPKKSPATPPQTPIIVQVQPSPQVVEAVAEKIAIDRALWGREPEFWLVIFSGALFIGTMLLWISTWQAANAAKKTSDLTLELERPYVYVRYPEAGLEEREVEKPNPQTANIELDEVARYKGPLTFLLVNFGRSPAILTEIFDDYIWLEGQHDVPPILRPETKPAKKQAHGTVTANGDPFGISKRPSLVFGQGKKRLRRDTFKEDSFFLQGYVRYSDVVGGVYMLIYCARFDRLSGKFLPVVGEEYNYTTVVRPRSWSNPFSRPQRI